MQQLIDRLKQENCSVVIRSREREQCCYKRGVADLLYLLKNEPEMLDHAQLADKVVGKGAAALMVLGQVSEVYARTISQPALALLQCAGISTTFGECVDHIINRAGTDWCPVEKLCSSVNTAEECLPLIEAFVTRNS